MNPAFECAFETPLDEMRERIRDYRRPALIVDENCVLVAKNRLAEYKIFKVRLGCSAKKMLTAGVFCSLADMKAGEIRRVRLKAEKPVSGAAARFRGYFLVFCLASREELARSVLEVNKAVGREALNMLSLRKTPDDLSKADMAEMEQLLFEHLLHAMNLSKMLEILTETGEGATTFFSPFLSAKAVCEIAEEFVGGRGGTFAARLFSTELCCRGAAAEYASALAAMVAFAGLHAKDGRLWAAGVVTDRAYKFGVRFVSDISRRELEALLCGGCGGEVRDIFLMANLLYIRCIADKALWDFGLDDDWRIGEGIGRRTGGVAGVSIVGRGVCGGACSHGDDRAVQGAGRSAGKNWGTGVCGSSGTGACGSGEAGPYGGKLGIRSAERGACGSGEACSHGDEWAVQGAGHDTCENGGTRACGSWGTGVCLSEGTASLLGARKRGAFDITLVISAPLLSGDYVELRRPTAAPEIFSAIRTQLLPLLRKRTQR